MENKNLHLVVDMYGCPNRCKHCWLGHMPNKTMEVDADKYIVDYFKPYFNSITYYSWMREPDFTDDYRNRWEEDKKISVNSTPKRFELASFWRIVRDPNYVNFLKEVGVKTVQLTFFGMEDLTDKYVGRKGSFDELIEATNILIDNEISPRWQVFINEENKDDILSLLDFSKELRLEERCNLFGGEFKFFVHPGSCDGENQKLYKIRIKKSDIPSELIPYFLEFDSILTEKECASILEKEHNTLEFKNEEDIVLNISNTYDVYFNFTNLSEEWKIGNLKIDKPDELVRKIIEEDTFAHNQSKKILVSELVNQYGNKNSERVFYIDDYRSYIFNLYLQDMIKSMGDTY